ncbi:AAA family ATPase [Flavobacterium frigoris]|uniref:ATPase n=1 Tax=Flavobacterium frigoris (strain PS1) TaxID=1086011 RepID=H7FSY5_FLAFP|nr:AAA family ATPase [Flavobacterium frigoris]EIA08682.1 ATPase [Flavobacterium frigoris PS1]
MEFKDFDELIHSINKSLGGFCNTFIYKRKELSKKGRSAKKGFLFVYDSDSNRNWSINEGGGTEIQYHIAFNIENLKLNYGLGFNTQYVPHANEFSSIDYMRPFMNAFLNNETKIQSILPNYSFVYGEKKMLIQPVENEYVLFGRTQIIQIREDKYFIEDQLYNEILEDLKKQFEVYIIIFEEKNKLKTMLSKIEKNIELLEYKKQIILQGPPGTGKTKTAKDIAVEMLGLGNVKDLNNNEQFKLIQFHPSYTYEDFVRGIISVPNENGEGVLFKNENKILAEIAEKALKNKIDSQKGSTELSKEKWLNEQFDKFIYSVSEILEVEEKIELTESVVIIEIDDDAFRYKGVKGWTKRGNRMLFKDIKQAYLDENFERQDLTHNHNLSGLAKWHASYYVRVLDMFKGFLKENKIDFIANTTQKEELKNYVLIIDEINRANLPSVLGELIYALEYRDEQVESMYEYEGKREIILPSNLYIIGTMNTADRSVGHIDYAIKRRFAFVDILPSDQAIDDVVTDPDLNAKAKGLYNKVAVLFNEDRDKTVYIQSDFKAKDVQLGHSYFLVETEKQLELKLEFEIKPLLNEYVKDGILSEDALLEIGKL